MYNLRMARNPGSPEELEVRVKKHEGFSFYEAAGYCVDEELSLDDLPRPFEAFKRFLEATGHDFKLRLWELSDEFGEENVWVGPSLLVEQLYDESGAPVTAADPPVLFAFYVRDNSRTPLSGGE